jgi:putative addiction module component (TIGR02574 family)
LDLTALFAEYMTISSELVNQVFALPPDQRYALAQQLLDSIDDEEASQFDAQFAAELNRRREELLRGVEQLVDWRTALLEIERSFPAGDTN